MNKMIVLSWLIVSSVHLSSETAHARWLNVNTGRFQTRDAYAGHEDDPTSLHKYIYSECNPANNSDPSGSKITLNAPPESPNVTLYNAAVAYLINGSQRAQTIIQKLQTCDHEYFITFDYAPPNPMSGSKEMEYIPSSHTVYWKPDMGWHWKQLFNHYLPPAMILMHELGHAYDQETDPKYNDNLKPYPSGSQDFLDWFRPEEKIDVQQNENPVEHDHHLPLRDNVSSNPDTDGYYQTTGPTSTKAVNAKEGVSLSAPGYDVNQTTAQ
jgi:hypothetical protein